MYVAFALTYLVLASTIDYNNVCAINF